MKIKIYILLALFILSQSVFADDIKDAEGLLRSKLDVLIPILKQKGIGKKTKKAKIVKILIPAFNLPLMAKLALGKKHWSGLSKENRKKFSALFIKRLKNSYIEKMILYTDEKIVYKTPIRVKRKIYIPVELITKNKKYTMLYKLYKSKYNWKIYDVEIEGVSVVRAYRSQFNDILKNGTFNELLLKLEKQENNNSK